MAKKKYSSIKKNKVVSLNLTDQGLIFRRSVLHIRVCGWPIDWCIHKVGFEPPTLLKRPSETHPQ